MESFEQLATQYTPMIYQIIRSLNIYTNKQEFFQIGLIGLWEASERFDPEKGNFTNYAYTFIKGRMMSELTSNRKYDDTTTKVTEEFWEYIEDPCLSSPLEEEQLLAYCQSANLTENQTKWVLYHCLKGFTTNEIAAIEQVTTSAVKNWRAGTKQKFHSSSHPLFTEYF
ncbi:sigma-70 family RNA polymerase sigma factor [Bacillus sp. B15-48]|uniref:sigma-70 family RNA polymerase sigma factor n=1 Tax=Bacillus sp. B15-48 TaxID=1548601 RepID=UPI00193F785C|nr:sigma-70 family RNA polymerase sigma factor [Bacillus sp. B15-48]MBM4764618.1 sigma-70 family RNA polymerase sigma factor [Bacillus sp. B15-48]